jgi:hypothetical protein
MSSANAIHHVDMADNLDLDLDLNLENIALTAVSSWDYGPGKRAMKPWQLFKIDRNGRKVEKQVSEQTLLVQARLGRNEL